jgi:hypothetical protein
MTIIHPHRCLGFREFFWQRAKDNLACWLIPWFTLSWQATSCGATLGGFYAASGNKMRKIVPLSGAFSAAILPPCAATRFLAIARPRPIPPESVDL